MSEGEQKSDVPVASSPAKPERIKPRKKRPPRKGIKLKSKYRRGPLPGANGEVERYDPRKMLEDAIRRGDVAKPKPGGMEASLKLPVHKTATRGPSRRTLHATHVIELVVDLSEPLAFAAWKRWSHKSAIPGMMRFRAWEIEPIYRGLNLEQLLETEHLRAQALNIKNPDRMNLLGRGRERKKRTRKSIAGGAEAPITWEEVEARLRAKPAAPVVELEGEQNDNRSEIPDIDSTSLDVD